jgi:hypothetical protein
MGMEKLYALKKQTILNSNFTLLKVKSFENLMLNILIIEIKGD